VAGGDVAAGGLPAGGLPAGGLPAGGDVAAGGAGVGAGGAGVVPFNFARILLSRSSRLPALPPNCFLVASSSFLSLVKFAFILFLSSLIGLDGAGAAFFGAGLGAGFGTDVSHVGGPAVTVPAAALRAVLSCRWQPPSLHHEKCAHPLTFAQRA